jgi:transcriptional regulator
VSAEQQIKAQQMLAGGHKPDAIAASLGVATAAVQALAQRLQAAKKPRR